MARPAKQLSSPQALLLLDFLLERHADLRLQSLRSRFADYRPRYVAAAAETRYVFAPHLPVPVELVDELRSWIDEHLTPDSWARVQAALRQRRQTQRRKLAPREERVERAVVTRDTAADLRHLAAKAGTDRKTMLRDLAAWLSYSPTGRRAMDAFIASKQKS